MNIVEARHQALLEKVNRGDKMTREETNEFGWLSKILDDGKRAFEARIANDPEIQRQRAESARQQNELAWTNLFSAIVEFGGGKWIAVDHQANRQEILSWLNPEEQTKGIPDFRSWFLQVLKDSPSLASKSGWEPYLTPAQQKQQQAEDQQKLREKFDIACKTHGLAPNEANFRVFTSVNDPVITSFFNDTGTDTPCIVLANGDTMELIAASDEQKQEWVNQEQTRSFNQRQADLRRMRDSDDIVGLKKLIAQERVETSRNIYQLHRDLQTLRGFAERQEYLLPPLPAHVNADTVKKGDRETVGKLGRTYGFARLTAVLNGQDETFFNNYDQKIKELQLQLGEKHTTH